MDNLDHRHSLLRLARRDFDALLGMQGSALFADAIFAFHAQQAVEKALKAWLTERRHPPAVSVGHGRRLPSTNHSSRGNSSPRPRVFCA